MCRILVVDDLADNVCLLQTILEMEGYAVDTADSGQAALNKLAANIPDLVLLDVMMPDMTGYEVTRQIRQSQNLSAVPIVLVTAYSELSASQGLATGANEFIRKPIDADQLLKRVKVYCD